MQWLVKKIRLTEEAVDLQEEAAFLAQTTWTEWARAALTKAAEEQVHNASGHLPKTRKPNDGSIG